MTVTGASHNDFADEHLDGTPCHDFIERVGLAFWDTALLGSDPTAAGFVRTLAAEGITDEGDLLSGVGATGELKSK